MKNLFTIFLLFGLGISGFSQCEDFDVAIESDDPTCFGFSNGSVISIPFGGESPYFVEITDTDGLMLNADGSNIANSLIEGWYYISVIDHLACVTEDSVQLTTMGMNLDDYTIVDHVGPGICNGSITIDDIPGYDMASLFFTWTGLTVADGYGLNSLVAACPGSYVLSISDDLGCSFAEDFIVEGETTAISESNITQSFKVNILNGQLNVFNELKETNVTEILVFDLMGKQIYASNLVEGQNSFQLQEKGLFIYQILAEGFVIQTGKVVDQH